MVRTASTTVDEELAAIDERASEQAADARWVVEEISTLSATIEEIAATANEVSERSDRAAAEAADGRAAAESAIDTMERVQAASRDVAAEVESLRERIDRIADALAGIDRIADQTNMLALNASIEAARTDGDADGFAVVADEIKQLAAESQSQADDIDAALEAVRTATDETVAQLETAAAEIDDGAEQVATAMGSLESVAETIEETADGVASVSTATDEQAETSEAVTERCEQLADRAAGVEEDITAIRELRSEQTAMLGEIDDVLSTLDADRRTELGGDGTIPTGIEGLDERWDGLVVGGQSVLRYGPETEIAGVVAGLCARAIADGRAVSLTPPPTLDRATLAAALTERGGSLEDALDDDRLFVLDAFGTWAKAYNVFDLASTSLGAVNETTVERRAAPLLVVGNIEGEVATVGEQAAREARYENDDGVFGPEDTVCNVVANDAVPGTLAAFYAGSADQLLTLVGAGSGAALEIERTAAGASGPRYDLETTSQPPFVSLA